MPPPVAVVRADDHTHDGAHGRGRHRAAGCAADGRARSFRLREPALQLLLVLRLVASLGRGLLGGVLARRIDCLHGVHVPDSRPSPHCRPATPLLTTIITATAAAAASVLLRPSGFGICGVLRADRVGIYALRATTAAAANAAVGTAVGGVVLLSIWYCWL